jgi:lincosamide nucleotidyltransferase A/C/D/E
MSQLESRGVAAWLDGGWGVDALLGEQTREHDDLDLVIALERSRAAQEALETLGFSVTEDETPTRFVMRDARGRQVDFHTVIFDAEGGGVQHLQDGGSFRYPPEGFDCSGRVGGRTFRCLTAEVQVRCHCGYEPDENDHHDVLLLCRRFGIGLPQQYGSPLPH